MRKVLGNKGEEIAAGYLQEQGYKILTRNYRCSYGEVDIICTYKQCIVFVEVKTRISKGFGSPEESITREKRNHIRKTALVYMEANPQSCKEIRFDVIGILFDGQEPRINHLVSAF
ncbi:MAG: YraN family protein [Syntrophomonas sp.]|nr:YraN family protein [Syntrophomonas sp.]